MALLLTAALVRGQRVRAPSCCNRGGYLSIISLSSLSYHWYGVWLPGPSIIIPRFFASDKALLTAIVAAANLFVHPWGV